MPSNLSGTVLRIASGSPEATPLAFGIPRYCALRARPLTANFESNDKNLKNLKIQNVYKAICLKVGSHHNQKNWEHGFNPGHGEQREK
jgi:hypothetical protein